MTSETSTDPRHNNLEKSMLNTQTLPISNKRMKHPELADVWVDFVRVTPALAEKLLGLNTRNRNVRERTLDSYARDKEAGNWVFNGDTVCFGRHCEVLDAILLDGQHRLMAIVKSGVSEWVLVVYGLDTSAQETMDTGIMRQVADQLRINGYANSNHVAALARKVMLWEHGHYALKGNMKWTATELLDLVDEDGRVLISAAWSASNARFIKAPGSVVSLAHWMFHEKNTEQAAWFMDRLADGAMLDVDHPVKRLRDRLDGHAGKRSRISEAEALALIITAWNAYRNKEKRKKLQLPTTLTNETMPRPV